MRTLALPLIAALLVLGSTRTQGGDVPARTKADVDKLIETEGATPPPWLDAVKLNCPPSLLLHWEHPDPKKKEPWTPSKYLSQYVWSVINENPGRWREGVRLMLHVLDVCKDEPANVVTTQRTLARMYGNLLQDPVRSAYWWKKSKIEDVDDEDLDDILPLAYCYVQLGNKDYARDLLVRIKKDFTRHGDAIKLWMDIGEYDKALAMAKSKADLDDADVAWLMAGETCRKMGKYADAIDYFNKALAVPQNKCGRDFKQTRDRARASLTAVKLYDALDLNKVADGTYTSDSVGYTGPVTVAVGVKAHKIDSVKVVKHTEKQYYGALTATPAQIIAKQSVKNIDTYSSATITSEAIVNATAKALSQGMK